MKMNPNFLCALTAITVCIGGLIATELIMNVDHQPLAKLPWPADPLWVSWGGMGIFIGIIVRQKAIKRSKRK